MIQCWKNIWRNNMSRKLIQIIAIIVCSVFDISAKSDTEDSVETYIYENHKEAVDAINKLTERSIKFIIKSDLIVDTIRVGCKFKTTKNDYSLQSVMFLENNKKLNLLYEMTCSKYKILKGLKYDAYAKMLIGIFQSIKSDSCYRILEDLILTYIAYHEFAWLEKCLDFEKAKKIHQIMHHNIYPLEDIYENLAYYSVIVYRLIPK